jgi:hypothetical protein
MLILIRYDFEWMELTAIPENGKDYCLICYYQKLGFQPVGCKYNVESFLKSFDMAIKMIKNIDTSDIEYKKLNINMCKMVVDRSTL